MAARGYLSRRSGKTNSLGYKSAKALRKKKLPPWDNSISNLMVHKPSKDELKRRHELHLPVHRDLDSYDTSEDYPCRNHSGSEMTVMATPEHTKKEHFTVLREIVNTNEKLQDALTYSDRSLSAVEDIFGDDPKKYRGFPNITCAPATNKPSAGSVSMLPVAFMEEPSLGDTGLDMLSNTIMDDTALNETFGLDEYKEDENNNVEASQDVASKRTAHEERTKDSERTVSTQQSSYSAVTQHPMYTSQSVDARPCITGGEMSSFRVSSTRSTLLASAPDMKQQNHQPTTFDVNTSVPTSENKTNPGPNVVKNSRRNESKSFVKSKSEIQATSFNGLHDLRQMVDNLEDEVRKYEIETGREQCSPDVAKKEKESFGGFTVSIMNAVTKLVGYLRICETQRKDDLAVKENIFLGFQQQQILINALTNDVICMQEENKKLRNEFETSKKTTDQQITFLKRELFAVLKTREYQTLSEDIDFFYDINSTDANNNQSKEKVADAIDITNELGPRDGFEYLPNGVSNIEIPQQTGTHYNHNQTKATSLLKNTTSTAAITIESMPRTGAIRSQPTGDINAVFQQTVKPRCSGTVGAESAEHDNVPSSDRELDSLPCGDQPVVSLGKHGTSGISTISGVTKSSSNVVRGEPLSRTTLSPPCVVPQDGNELSVNLTSVFLGRNQSMSPHHRSSDVPFRDDKHEHNSKTLLSSVRKRAASNIEKTGERQTACVDEMSKMTLKDGSRSDPSIRTHVSLGDDIPFREVHYSSQSQASPVVSPIFYERQSRQGSRNDGEKLVVTVPSMWEDARISPVPQQAVVSRENRLFAPVTSNVKPTTRQKSDKGWFALSSHVD